MKLICCRHSSTLRFPKAFQPIYITHNNVVITTRMLSTNYERSLNINYLCWYIYYWKYFWDTIFDLNFILSNHIIWVLRAFISWNSDQILWRWKHGGDVYLMEAIEAAGRTYLASLCPPPFWPSLRNSLLHFSIFYWTEKWNREFSFALVYFPLCYIVLLFELYVMHIHS